MLETKDFLRGLSEATGISGYEGGIASLVEAAFRPYIDEVRRDKLGNCILFKRGNGREPRPKVMFAAHMDEIGLMVTKIEERGFIRFTRVGGIDPRTILAQEVMVHGKRPLPGVIGAKPPHLTSAEEARKAPGMEDLFVDVGLPKEEVEGLVRLGDLITVRRQFIELLGGAVAGKAFDDRAGVAILLEAMRELHRIKHEADIYAVATVQEEVTLGGAITSTYGILPDVGIAVDVTFGDMPGLPDQDTFVMDKGPAIAIGPNIHPKVHEALTKTARDLAIPFQVDVAPGATGTDAWAIQVARTGVPTGLVSLPLRYMHTSVEMTCLSDIKKSGRLLAEFAAGVDGTFLEGLKWD